MKKIAVILSGCGFQDGSEITEAVSTLISLGQNGASYRCFAPDVSFEAVNHLSSQKDGDKRNCYQESARIARGQVQRISQLDSREYDGIAFPGGFGAALHLCDWAHQGSSCTVQPEIQKTIEEFYMQQKPIAAICIAPALIARVLGSHNIEVTIGNDSETAKEIEKTGARHIDCPVDDFVTDRDHKIITTPAYMYGEAKPHEVFAGVSAAVKELTEMA